MTATITYYEHRTVNNDWATVSCDESGWLISHDDGDAYWLSIDEDGTYWLDDVMMIGQNGEIICYGINGTTRGFFTRAEALDFAV